jgi:hypothetical protein
MATAERLKEFDIAPSAFGELVRKVWDVLAVALAVIGLVDLTDQVVKWAARIHDLALKYATWRDWAFSFSPIHIPPEWHNYIVLAFIFFSASNVGYYQIKRQFLFIRSLLFAAPPMVFDLLSSGTHHLEMYVPLPGPDVPNIMASRAPRRRPRFSFATVDRLASRTTKIAFWIFVLLFLAYVCTKLYPTIVTSIATLPANTVIQRMENVLFVVGIIASGTLIAWRWIVGTAVVFGVLVGVNDLYVRFIEPTMNMSIPV